MYIYKNIPPLDPAVITLPIKTFFIEQRWREAAIINAIHDYGGTGASAIRDGFLFLGPLEHEQPAWTVLRGIDIVSRAKSGDFLPAFQGLRVRDGCQSFPLGIVDIVTYPFWFALVYGVELDKDMNLLMHINHTLSRRI